MQHVSVQISDDLAWITLSRGKVNALNDELVDELRECFQGLADNSRVRAVVLTGRGKFFSFGLDIPELLDFPKEPFADFVKKFTELYTEIFLFPKPVVAALNGHAIAGGCMLATACDYRLMVSGKAKISLNEITFGCTVLAGSVEMLKACTGHRNAHVILYSGAMLSADEAFDLGLIDQKTSDGTLKEDAEKVAQELAGRDERAFASIKLLVRRPTAEEMRKREEASIKEFVEIWYSENTWSQLQEIKIRG